MKEEEVKKLLYEEFLKWMRGQTIQLDENDKPMFYQHDVEAFLIKIRTGYDRQKSIAWD